MKTISIVTPCYNEEANVEACVEAVRKLFASELAGLRPRAHLLRQRLDRSHRRRSCRRWRPRIRTSSCIVNSRNFGIFRKIFNGVLCDRRRGGAVPARRSARPA